MQIFQNARDNLRCAAVGLACALGLLSADTSWADTKEYVVFIETSDIGGAGTDADVFITFYGTQSKDGTGKKKIEHSGRNFVRGKLEAFYVLVDETVGELEKIKLEHDNSGPGAAWHVKNVSVNEPNDGTDLVVFFTINDWLSDDHGKQTHVTKKRDDYEKWKENYANRMPTPEGEWVFVCGGSNGCTQQISQSYTVANSRSTTWSNTAKLAVTATYTKRNVTPDVGFTEYQASVTAEDAFTKTRTIAKTESFGHTETCTQTFNPEKYLINSVWQWSATTNIEGKLVTIKTCDAVCTPTGGPPRFAAGDIRLIDSCLASRDFAFVPNRLLKRKAIEVEDNVSIARCQQMCRDRTWCKSFDYRKKYGRCYLNNLSDNDVALIAQDGNGYDHYYLPERRNQPVQSK